MHDARRRSLRTLAGLALGAAFAPSREAAALGRHGRIEPPEPVPEVSLVLDDGRRTTLERQLLGRATALHFMFTGCASTCPIQGATFAQLQERVAPRRTDRMQLLSVSVDALGDDAASLSRWRARLAAGPMWRAAVPGAAHADRLLRWAGGERPGAVDTHATQVLLLDDRARLVFRTIDLPDAREVAELLVVLDRRIAGR
jgi:protein SCO1/2